MDPGAIHLDNAATSWPKPDAVVDALREWFVQLGVDAHRGGSGRHQIVSHRVESLRVGLGRLVGVPAQQVLLGPGSTWACNLFLKGLLRPGMRVWTSAWEHNAVARPLMGLARREGIHVDVLTGSGSGILAVEDLQAHLAERGTPDLLAPNHASNVTGEVQDLEPLLAWARNLGITTFVDVAQSAGRLDLASLGADAYAIPGHKGLMGPPGVGALCLRDPRILVPLLEGGTGSTRATDRMPEELPRAHEAGTPNSPGLLAWLAGLQWVQEQGPSRLLKDELALLDRLASALAPLQAQGRIRIHAAQPDRPRVAVMSLRCAELDPAEIALILDQEGFALRAGYHCAPWIHQRLGTEEGGTLRIGPGPFNREADIDRLAALLSGLV